MHAFEKLALHDDSHSAHMISSHSPKSSVAPNQRTVSKGFWEKLALGVFLSLGLWARVHEIGKQSLWIDEAYSLDLAQKGFSEIVRETARDNHPPLHYLLLACWNRLEPASESWPRLLSALLGTLLIFAFYEFCCEVASGWVPIIATGLISISPLAVWHSQDARMYSLMLTVTYLALVFQLRYLRLGNPVWLVSSVLMLVASLYTHIYAIFVLPALVVHLLLVERFSEPRRTRLALIGIAVTVGAFLPWIYVVATSAMHEAGFYKPITWLTIPYAGYAFSVGYSLGPSVTSLHQVWREASLWSHLGPIVVLTAAAFGIPCMVGVFRARKILGRFRFLVGGLALCPILLPIMVTFASRIDFNARYAILAFPVFLLFIAIGLVEIPSHSLRFTTGAVIVALMVVSLWNYYEDVTYAKEDSREAVRLVSRQWRDGDCLLVIGVGPAFRYYAGSALTSHWLDFRSQNRLVETKRALQDWTGTCSRLWFVAGREWEADPAELAIPTIETYFIRVSEESVPGIRILQLLPRRRFAL